MPVINLYLWHFYKFLSRFFLCPFFRGRKKVWCIEKCSLCSIGIYFIICCNSFLFLFMIMLWDVNVMLEYIIQQSSSDYKILSLCHNDSYYELKYLCMHVCCYPYNGHLLTPSIFIEYVNLSKRMKERKEGAKNFLWTSFPPSTHPSFLFRMYMKKFFIIISKRYSTYIQTICMQFRCFIERSKRVSPVWICSIKFVRKRKRFESWKLPSQSSKNLPTDPTSFQYSQ